MRTRSARTWAIRLALVLVFIVGSVLMISASGPVFTKHDKAFYADPNLVNFVRPGLKVTIESAEIAADGSIKTKFKLADPKGLPLDKDGITTPGTVGLRLIAAYIPNGKTQYVDYVTRTQTSPITGKSAVQAADENNGTFTKVSDGEYEYVFKNKVSAEYDKTATHTVGITAARDLSEFELGINLYDTVYSWVPGGGPVTKTRDVIKTVTCNKCHQGLSAHGETGRRSLEVCILCHQPQTVDPDTGHSVNMVEMAHKIHMGEELPSVKAGTPYQIIGYRQTVVDFSKVVFPADTRRCTFCHEQNTGAAQATAYLKPNRVACGACHDNVNFATGENHAGLAQISDNQCANCHTPEGELEFDISIAGAHTIPTFSKALPGTVFELISVTNAAPGKQPTITFTLKDKAGNAINPANMTRLSLLVAGPTTDYAGYIREDATKATAAADGTAVYTMTWTVPADATGSYTVGIEGYRNIKLLPGQVKEQTARDAGVNKNLDFSVDGSPVVPRRTIVSIDKCNQCHAFLALHGGNRNRITECVLCHNPNQTTAAPKPPDTTPPQGVNFTMMIHKIHNGENLPYEYKIGNTTFNEVLFPGKLNNCDGCHVNDSQTPPLSENLLNVKDPRGLLNPVAPNTAACTACHTEKHVASHALANTTILGESCAACHSAEAAFSVDKVHAQ